MKVIYDIYLTVRFVILLLYLENERKENARTNIILLQNF